MWFAFLISCIILMGEVFTIHCGSVGADLKKRNFSIEWLFNAPLHISQAAYWKWKNILAPQVWNFMPFHKHKLRFSSDISISTKCRIETISHWHFSTSWHGMKYGIFLPMSLYGYLRISLWQNKLIFDTWVILKMII